MSEHQFDDIFLRGLLDHAGDAVGPDTELLDKCESPIERRFGEAFMLHTALLEGRPMGKQWERYEPRPQIILEPQYKIDKYRVDFLIFYAGSPARSAGLVVECDGHDFHEKTREQAARDKARDRLLAQRFGMVARFTGSEIFNKPFDCAEEAFYMLDGLYCDWGGGK